MLRPRYKVSIEQPVNGPEDDVFCIYNIFVPSIKVIDDSAEQPLKMPEPVDARDKG